MTEYNVSIEKGSDFEDTYKIGDVFSSEDRNQVLLLAQVDKAMCCMIDLSGGGNRQFDPYPVQNIFEITKEEVYKMVDFKVHLVEKIHISTELGKEV